MQKILLPLGGRARVIAEQNMPGRNQNSLSLSFAAILMQCRSQYQSTESQP